MSKWGGFKHTMLIWRGKSRTMIKSLRRSWKQRRRSDRIMSIESRRTSQCKMSYKLWKDTWKCSKIRIRHLKENWRTSFRMMNKSRRNSDPGVHQSREQLKWVLFNNNNLSSRQCSIRRGVGMIPSSLSMEVLVEVTVDSNSLSQLSMGPLSKTFLHLQSKDLLIMLLVTQLERANKSLNPTRIPRSLHSNRQA